MILIVGASGYIGREVIRQIDSDFKVVKYKSDVGFCRNNPHCKGVVNIDLKSKIDVSLLRGVTVILNLAGVAHKKHSSTCDYDSVNRVGVRNLAEAAVFANVSTFIHLSTINVFGLTSSEFSISSDLTLSPATNYAVSKARGESELLQVAQHTDLSAVIVRSPLVYGFGAPGNFGMLTKLIRKLPIAPFGSAENIRDFMSVQNLADLLLFCSRSTSAAGHTFLASDGEPVSMKQFTNAIAEGLGTRILQVPIPVSLITFVGRVTGRSKMIEQLYGSLEVDSSGTKEILGWSPPYTMKQAMATLRDLGESNK
ncbi:NAD-dependent epimerase/dehydratase family protein [Vibrio genomosp. F6]|uniref:NAD-dependent epimerase/dehydratase domain-containing protein n=1 Tax=Vibrio genomosp. F6 str. FF-238 TaxID=1191298 RepID=A0A1E5D2F5_9VIBR|nr:NAD-dependent epimerase/dehydratase family protein [Vibrio genomosp. F6]OEE77706.1 hypothetical protein A130_14340 [Vibrio genomosp. F6 str. FF-238]